MRIKIRLHAESVREISFCPPSSLADSKKTRERAEREREQRERAERERFFEKKI